MSFKIPFFSRILRKPPALPKEEPGMEVGVKSESYSWTIDDSDRIGTCNIIQEICKTDPVIEQALRLVSRAAAYFPDGDKPIGFYFSGKPKVINYLDSFVDRIGLRDISPSIIYNLYKYGEVFAEIVYKTGFKGIAAVRPFSMPYWIRANLDDFGRLKNGVPKNEAGSSAYDEYIDGATYYTSFRPEQISHWAFNPDVFYGVPVLVASAASWKQMRAVIERIAYVVTELRPMRLHNIPIPNAYGAEYRKKVIQNYMGKLSGYDVTEVTDSDTGEKMAKFTRKVARPVDIFVPARIIEDRTYGVEIENVESPDVSRDLEMVKMWRGMVLSNLGVPPEYLPVETGERRVNAQEVQIKAFVFAAAIRDVQEAFKRELTRICRIELLLNADNLKLNIDQIADKKLFQIVMPRVPFVDDLSHARVRQAQAQAILQGVQSGVDPKWWIGMVMDIDEEDLRNVNFSLPTNANPFAPPADTVEEEPAEEGDEEE